MRILMAVAYYPRPFVGGLERQAHELSRELAVRGHEVRVLTTRFEKGQAWREACDGVEVFRVRWIANRPLRFLVSPFSLGWQLLCLWRRTDVVHVHNISWFGAYITVCARLLGVPVITKLPNTGSRGIPGMRARMFGRIRTALLGWSDAITAFTPESLEELRGIGYPAGRVLQAPNGVSLATTASPVPRRASEAVTVVYVGRLLSEKGVEDLLRAWLEVSIHARRPVLLRLVGTGPKDEDLRRLVSTLRVRDSVEFVGYIDDVTGQLSSADVFVLPSYGEGNSNAILEAMRAGLPIVATRVGGTPYQVGAAGQRYLVEPGDTLAMSERLLALIHDDAARLGVGSEMRARVERLFGIDRVAQSYEHAYRLIRAGRREELGRIESYLSS